MMRWVRWLLIASLSIPACAHEIRVGATACTTTTAWRRTTGAGYLAIRFGFTDGFERANSKGHSVMRATAPRLEFGRLANRCRTGWN